MKMDAHTYRHHDALYDDIISAHPFKFWLANQKARYTNLANRSPHSNQWFFFVGVGAGAEILTSH